MEDYEIYGGILTVNHSASSYGQPVWIYQEKAYGPGDLDPKMSEKHEHTRSGVGKIMTKPSTVGLMVKTAASFNPDTGGYDDEMRTSTPEIVRQFVGLLPENG